MKDYIGVDLKKLDDTTRYVIYPKFEQLTNTEYWIDARLPFEPWYLWSYNQEGSKVKYILFEAQRLVTIPGASRARIHLFDKEWNTIYSTTFSTGWRNQLVDADFTYNDQLETQIITIYIEPFLINADGQVYRQFYSLIDDRIALIRLEDSEGHMVINVYSHNNLTIGPFPSKSAVDWKIALMSEKPPEVLEALTWLSGDHRPFDGLDIEYPNLESSTYSMTNETLKTDSEIDLILSRLEYSEAPWIAEAAKLAKGSK